MVRQFSFHPGNPFRIDMSGDVPSGPRQPGPRFPDKPKKSDNDEQRGVTALRPFTRQPIPQRIAQQRRRQHGD